MLRRPDGLSTTTSRTQDYIARFSNAEWHFELAAFLGSGTFGCTFRAWRWNGIGKVDRTAVAVKLPRVANGGVDAITSEIQILQMLDHPGIIRCLAAITHADIHDSWSLPPDSSKVLPGGVSNEGPGLLMSLGDFDLKHFLDTHAPIGDPLAREWCRQLADAAAHMHYKGVVHRDIKPQNILVFLDAAVGAHGVIPARLVMCDFGMARELPPAAPPRKRIRGKLQVDCQRRPTISDFPMSPRVCTFWYRAPEIMAYYGDDSPAVHSTASYGTSADIWALGAVFFEIMSGKVLARAPDCVGALSCLLAVLGPPGTGTDAPAYTKELLWQTLCGKASPESRMTGLRHSLPAGPQGEVLRSCLHWRPESRATARRICSMPWILSGPTLASLQGDCGPGAALASLQGGHMHSNYVVALSAGMDNNTTAPSHEIAWGCMSD